MSRRRTDRPAKGTIRSRRHAALRDAGYAVYRATVHEDRLTDLVRRGLLPDRETHDQAAVERALTEWLDRSLPVDGQSNTFDNPPRTLSHSPPKESLQ